MSGRAWPASGPFLTFFRENEMQMIRVRIRATGQVLLMIPNVARAMIGGRTAVEVDENGRELVETAALDRSRQTAVAPAQKPVKKKGK
jgi:hypothetical protein